MDDWQQWVLHWACMEQPLPESVDPQWSAFEVALLVSRQAGKGAILEARQLAGLFYFREPFAVHSAHEFKTAHEHFLRMINLIEGCPDLDRQVHKIRRGAGEQAIELKTGERLRFIARSTGSGRGMTGDVVYLDEAFALTDAMLGALMPTLSAVPNPQIWYTSSAPRPESSVLHGIRKRGRKGDGDRLFFSEWCADVDAQLDDVDAWYQANPALGIRITEEYVRAEYEAMSAMPDEFRRERLGIPEEIDETSAIIPLNTWDLLEDRASEAVGRVVLALDVSPDRKWASVSAAGRRDDGVFMVETVVHKPGTSWVVPELPGLLAKSGSSAVRIEKGGPAASLIGQLLEAGVEVDEVSTADHARATGLFIDSCLSGGLRHLGQQSLRSAVVAAKLRASGDAELWSRRSSSMDITPLVAATIALGGVPELVDVKQPLDVFYA